MTINQAAALRVKWKQRADRPPCEHLSLELELDELGHSTGDITYFICGEFVSPGLLAA